MRCLTQLTVGAAFAATLFAGTACTNEVATGSGSSGISGSDASTNPGFDCIALRDKQAAASCPKFDTTKYLADCEDTKSRIAPACKSKADALANCMLNQPIGCTDAGQIADDTPAACKSLEQDFVSCK